MSNNYLCPNCGRLGELVNQETVKHMVNDNKIEQVTDSAYYICLDETCDVVYYNINNKIFVKDEIKVPIWYKNDSDPKYACYCSNVTEDQVIEAVLSHGAKTVKEVNDITGAMKNSNCIENNPLGKCCHLIIQKVIDKALLMVN